MAPTRRAATVVVMRCRGLRKRQAHAEMGGAKCAAGVRRLRSRWRLREKRCRWPDLRGRARASMAVVDAPPSPCGR